MNLHGTPVYQKVAKLGLAPTVANSTKVDSEYDVPETSKYITKNYQFPKDVEGPPGVGNQGHYIMFMINEQQGARLRFGNREKSEGEETIREEMAERAIPEYIKKMVAGNLETVENTDGSDEVLEKYNYLKNITGKSNTYDKKESRTSGSTVYVDRAPTVRLDTAITMYMPPSVKVTYGANYTDTEIGAGAELINDVYANVMAGSGTKSVISSALDKLGPAVSETILNGLLATVGAMPGMAGSREAFEMSTGVVQTKRMELAFKGIGKRSFQYDFKMIPKSEEEANEVRKIIFAFKANMLPEFKNGNRSGRKLRVPNTFDIQYMYSSGENSTQENDYLHRISTCVLKNMDVTYGGDRYRTFTANEDGAPPIETSISLQFEELELITKERVYEGY